MSGSTLLPAQFAEALALRTGNKNVLEVVANTPIKELVCLCFEGAGYLDESYSENFDLIFGAITAMQAAKSSLSQTMPAQGLRIAS